MEILQNAAPDEGVHLPSALTLYFDFVEKREQQRISKNLEAKKQLPIFKHREEIVQLVKEHQVSVRLPVAFAFAVDKTVGSIYKESSIKLQLKKNSECIESLIH